MNNYKIVVLDHNVKIAIEKVREACELIDKYIEKFGKEGE